MTRAHNDNSTTRIAILENTIEHINETLKRLDNRLDRIDAKLDSLESRMWSNFLWLMATYLAGYAGILGIMAKFFHWGG